MASVNKIRFGDSRNPPEFRDTWPITLAPSRNVTMPLGISPPEGTDDTVAVNEINAPTFEGLGETESCVFDALEWTV